MQFLTELADKGVNVRVIQALARQKDISTTQRYIDYTESKLRNAIERKKLKKVSHPQPITVTTLMK
jgi:site-specific recombinase XerD